MNLSIIVPVYNHEAYVSECFYSILNANISCKHEVVFLDDGSTDNSAVLLEILIKESKKSNYKLLRQVNSGISKTLNRLIEYSSGSHIVICASDDMLLPEGVTERLQFLENNPTKLAVIGDALAIDSNGGTIAQSAMSEYFGVSIEGMLSNIKRELVINWGAIPSTLMVKRKIFDIIGQFDESLKVEDRDFFLRMLSVNLLGFTSANVSCYRILTTSASRGGARKRFDVYNDVARANVRHAKNFSGLEYLYLNSHRLDVRICNKYTPFRFVQILIVKIFRKSIFKALLFLD